jgi:hypothetical protein
MGHPEIDKINFPYIVLTIQYFQQHQSTAIDGGKLFCSDTIIVFGERQAVGLIEPSQSTNWVNRIIDISIIKAMF